jgi:hypothetical protein
MGRKANKHDFERCAVIGGAGTLAHMREVS